MEHQYIEHTTAAHQDLFFLAEYYYGSAVLWWIIYHANGELIGDDPEDVLVGTTLRIPLLETKRARTAMPTFIPATAFEASQDPLVQFARDRFNDVSLYFDLLEANGLDAFEVITAGTDMVLPARGNPYDLKKAVFYREKFYGENY